MFFFIDKIIFIRKILSIVGIYFLKKYLKYNSKVDFFDVKLFNDIDSIISANEIIEIIENSGSGYLPKYVYNKATSLIYFVKNPIHTFNNKDIQNKFIVFYNRFIELSQLYASSSYSIDIDGFLPATKLLGIKSGSKEDIEFLNKENLIKTTELNSAYKEFRSIIRKKFLI